MNHKAEIFYKTKFHIDNVIALKLIKFGVIQSSNAGNILVLITAH